MSAFTIGLTLSGGGARGLAHIGVLRALLEHDVVPDRIVGVFTPPTRCG